MILFLLFFLAALFQVSFFSYFAISGIVPDIMLTVMVLWLHRHSEESHMILILIASGAMLDLLSGALLGVSSISLLISYWLVRLLMREDIKNENNFFLFVILVCVTFIFNIAQLILLNIFHGSAFVEIMHKIQYYFVNIFWVKSIYNVGLLFIILALKKLLFASSRRKISIGMVN